MAVENIAAQMHPKRGGDEDFACVPSAPGNGVGGCGHLAHLVDSLKRNMYAEGPLSHVV